MKKNTKSIRQKKNGTEIKEIADKILVIKGSSKNFENDFTIIEIIFD